MIINILDISISNRIAAGEVVENPSSVVKELLDNSIDAGANEICVKIQEGGIKSIEVSDNGSGIPQKELPKSILTNATSKISTSDDLFSISTLGFRGEALSSIASVSEFEIKTRSSSDANGALLVYKNDKAIVSDYAWENGTFVSVKNLFYNTPARYKFLSSMSVEENNIKKVLFQYILSNPYIQFNYITNNKLVYSSDGQGLKSAINSVYCKDIAPKLLFIDDTSSPIKITGYLSPPNIFKHNRNMQTIVINGRVINDSNISSIVQNAYDGSLMKHCFPIFVLHILIPFEEVDVNVHPTKKEVRFSNSKKIYGKIYNSVKTVLEAEKLRKQQEVFDYSSTISKPQLSKQNAPIIILDKEITSEIPSILNNSVKDISFFDNSISTGKIDETDFSIKSNDAKINKLEESIQYDYSVIGQVFDTYLIIEVKDTVFFIDQHALHEKILYDSFLQELNENKRMIQPLLIPELFICTNSQKEALIRLQDKLASLGFEIDDFGENTIRISTVPSILSDKVDLILLFEQISRDINPNISLNSVKMLFNDKIAMMACKAAIKGNTEISKDKINLIIKYFFDSGFPLQCPHGRPTFATFSKNDFEKLFKRKV